MAPGVTSSYALSSDGSLWVWCSNSAGQMGFGNENETYTYLTPQHLLPPVGYRFTSIDNTNGSLHVVATLAAVPEPSRACSPPWAVQLARLPPALAEVPV